MQLLLGCLGAAAVCLAVVVSAVFAEKRALHVSTDSAHSQENLG